MKHTSQLLFSTCPAVPTSGVALLLLLTLAAARAVSPEETSPHDHSLLAPVGDYFANWFKRVDAARASQPHWAPALVTTSPNLTETLRYDIMQQQDLRNGRDLTSYGGGKGLELILSERLQFNVSIPAWQTVNTSPTTSGWADENFLIKYRLFAANEQKGNYVLTLLGGMTAPTGSDNISSHHFTFIPGIGFGKGWGDFDIQGTAGVAIPDNGASATGSGTPFQLNTAFQYRIAKVIWPQVEANYTYWPNGRNEHLNQLFLTPGIIVGRFPLWRRVGVMVGIGCQIAVTDNPLYHRNYILSVRFPF